MSIKVSKSVAWRRVCCPITTLLPKHPKHISDSTEQQFVHILSIDLTIFQVAHKFWLAHGK